jgi:hypothetical protein
MIPRADERPKTIALQISGPYDEGRSASQGTAADNIGPGCLIELVETTDVPRVPSDCQRQSTAGEDCAVRIAVEDRMSGRGPEYKGGRSLDDLFEDEDIVPFRTLLPGDIALVRIAATADFAQGDKLEAAGDGTFVALASGKALVEAYESVDYGASVDGLEKFIRVVAL